MYKIKRFSQMNSDEYSFKDYGNKVPEGVMPNINGNPIWIDLKSERIKPIDKFKLDPPSEEFKEEMELIPPSSERKLKGQMKAINEGYADKDKPPFKENTKYLNYFQTEDGVSLPYSKKLDSSNRFTYAIHKPKKEGSKYVSHVEPVNCKDHKYRGIPYAHNKSGLFKLSDENLSKLKKVDTKSLFR